MHRHDLNDLMVPLGSQRRNPGHPGAIGQPSLDQGVDDRDFAARVGMCSCVARVYIRRRASRTSAPLRATASSQRYRACTYVGDGQQKPASREGAHGSRSAGKPRPPSRDIAPHASPLSPTSMNRSASRLIMYDLKALRGVVIPLQSQATLGRGDR